MEKDTPETPFAGNLNDHELGDRTADATASSSIPDMIYYIENMDTTTTTTAAELLESLELALAVGEALQAILFRHLPFLHRPPWNKLNRPSRVEDS